MLSQKVILFFGYKVNSKGWGRVDSRTRTPHPSRLETTAEANYTPPVLEKAAQWTAETIVGQKVSPKITISTSVHR